MTEQKIILANDEIILENQWVPSGPPLQLLPPSLEPEISKIEISDLEKYCEVYYLRSGRYLGHFKSKQAADQCDHYRYSRMYVGEILPWEAKG